MSVTAQGEYRPGIKPPPETMLMKVCKVLNTVTEPKELVLGHYAWIALRGCLGREAMHWDDRIPREGRWYFMGVPVTFTHKNDYEVTVGR